MLKILFVLLLSGFVLSGYGQSADSLTIKNIDGADVSLLSYQGKKILFLIAPSDLSDSLKVNEIAAFNAQYGDSLHLVCIMSKEDGYVDSNKAAIKSMYQSRGLNVLLTEGMYTKKAAGTNQSTLMQWLTKRSINKRFDEDAGGVGQQFYVNENGKLFSVLVAQTPLLSPAVKRNIDRKM